MEPTPHHRSIVVGVDGSGSADHALRWAALEAHRTAALLRIVCAWSVPNSSWGVATGAYVDPREMREAAKRTTQRALRSVRRQLGLDMPKVELLTELGRPADALVHIAAGSDLLVVGTRGRGGFASLVLGSVAIGCAHHSTVPVAIIGKDAPDPGSSDIVVGFDDSPGARRALGWAAAEAARLGCALRVVHGWDLPTVAPFSGSEPGPIDEGGRADGVQRWLELQVAEATADLPARPSITIDCVAAPAPEALVTQAKDASLLVVGSRGRGGFAGLLLGSVSQQCMHHSPAPIVVVPSEVAASG